MCAVFEGADARRVVYWNRAHPNTKGMKDHPSRSAYLGVTAAYVSAMVQTSKSTAQDPFHLLVTRTFFF